MGRKLVAGSLVVLGTAVFLFAAILLVGAVMAPDPGVCLFLSDPAPKQQESSCLAVVRLLQGTNGQ